MAFCIAWKQFSSVLRFTILYNKLRKLFTKKLAGVFFYSTFFLVFMRPFWVDVGVGISFQGSLTWYEWASEREQARENHVTVNWYLTYTYWYLILNPFWATCPRFLLVGFFIAALKHYPAFKSENLCRCSTKSIHFCKKLPLALDWRQSKYYL